MCRLSIIELKNTYQEYIQNTTVGYTCCSTHGLAFVVSAIPDDEVRTQTILPIQREYYDLLIEKCHDLYRQEDYKGVLHLGHQLLYQVEIPLCIRFKCLWAVVSAHNHLRQGQTAISFLNEYLRCCDLLAESWKEEGFGSDRLRRLKEKVISRINEVRDDIERPEDEKTGVGEALALRELNHSLDMAELQEIQDRESKRVSSVYWDDPEHSDESTTNDLGLIAPNIPPRSRLRHAKRSETKGNESLSLIPLPHGPGNAFQSNSPGFSRQTPFATNFVQTKSDLETGLYQFLAPFTKAYIKQSRATALIAQCLQIINDVECGADETVDLVAQSATQTRPYQSQFNHPNPSEFQSDLRRLRKDVEQRDRRIYEQDNRIHEQEELIRKKDEIFAEQVDLLNRSYDRIHEKNERIRRLEAEAVVLKNANEKCERAIQKQILRSQASGRVYIPTGTGSSAASLASESSMRSTSSQPHSDSSGNLRTPSTSSTQALGASDEESFLGIPLLALPPSAYDTRPPISRSTTLPSIAGVIDSRPPISRMPRSLSTNSIGLAPVREMSPAPPIVSLRSSPRTQPLAKATGSKKGSTIGEDEKVTGKRGFMKGAFSKVVEKIKSARERKE